jgi:predicted regulator of Ras-like GTPase activity (Roadblock/LC7/MglB family)
MEVPQAFSDLLEVSSQVENAIVLEEDTVAASSISDQSRSEEVAAALRRLVETAEETHAGFTQLQVALPEGNVFLIREGKRLVAATTAPDPPSGLVFYDLRTCLSALADRPRATAGAAVEPPTHREAEEEAPSDAAP